MVRYCNTDQSHQAKVQLFNFFLKLILNLIFLLCVELENQQLNRALERL